MSLNIVESVCIAWRKVLKHIWDLPLQTGSRLTAPICELLPIRYELVLHRVSFIVQCMSSDNIVVCTISHYGVYFRYMLSPIDANVIFLLQLFGCDPESNWQN